MILGLIKPVGDAFRTGELLMGNDVVSSAAATASAWSSYPLNWTLTLLAAIALTLNIPNIYYLAPHLWKAFSRWRWSLTIEASIPLSRARDYMALFCVVPFALIADRYSLFSMELLELAAPSWHVLAVLALLLALYIVRTLVYYALEGRSPKLSLFQAARKTERTFFIILTFLTLVEVGILTVSGASDQAIRNVLRVTCAIIYFAFLIKKGQILVSFCSPLSTFLYLCALEFVPVGMLIAACVLF